MSSSIITVCTRIHAVLSNKTYTRHTHARAHTSDITHGFTRDTSRRKRGQWKVQNGRS